MRWTEARCHLIDRTRVLKVRYAEMAQSRHYNHGYIRMPVLQALQQNGKSVHRGTAVEKERERAQGELQLTLEADEGSPIRP
jgi:hypothetical protein